MELKIHALSNEMIKPSKPTPSQSKRYELSFVDQLISLEYGTPLVFFYEFLPASKSVSTITHLKQSLEKALSLYYPLAGRLMIHEACISCGDQGVPLVTALANCSLSTYINSPNREESVPGFIPRDNVFLDPSTMEVKGLIMIAFQITLFECGGFAIGSQPLSQAFDGASGICFFRTWGAIAYGNDALVRELVPDFSTRVALFPPAFNEEEATPMAKEMAVPPVLQPVFDEERTSVVKVFEFSSSNIGVLQLQAKSESVPNPTRVESVTCFLWKHLMAAAAAAAGSSINKITSQDQKDTTKDQSKTTNISGAIHSVNLRPHLNPPLQPTTFGKFVTHCFAIHKNIDTTPPKLSDLVTLLREALLKCKDKQVLESFHGLKGVKTLIEHKHKLDELSPLSYFFTSLKGFEDVDYGSGPPAWIGLTGGRPSYFFRNYIPLIHTPSKAIQAWVLLDEKEMNILESDSKFLAMVRSIGV